MKSNHACVATDFHSRQGVGFPFSFYLKERNPFYIFLFSRRSSPPVFNNFPGHTSVWPAVWVNEPERWCWPHDTLEPSKNSWVPPRQSGQKAQPRGCPRRNGDPQLWRPCPRSLGIKPFIRFKPADISADTLFIVTVRTVYTSFTFENAHVSSVKGKMKDCQAKGITKIKNNIKKKTPQIFPWNKNQYGGEQYYKDTGGGTQSASWRPGFTASILEKGGDGWEDFSLEAGRTCVLYQHPSGHQPVCTHILISMKDRYSSLSDC